MTLVDTSVWVDHLRSQDETLTRLLTDGQVLAHPFTIGELALGHLRDRDETLTSLRDLPAAVVATDEEVLGFINREGSSGLDIGYVDTHLLVATLLSDDAVLWTRDKRLLRVAARFVPLASERVVN